MRLDPTVHWILRLGLAWLFAAAATHKLRDREQFRAVLANYRLVPSALVGVAAGVVVGLELFVTALLLVRPSGAGGLVGAMLLAGYAAALGINLVRGRTRIDCGCLGAGRTSRISWWMVVRNLALAGLALVATLPPGARAVTALDLMTIVGTVLTAALLYLALGQLLSAPVGRREAA
jgi:hypothetical protein